MSPVGSAVTVIPEGVVPVCGITVNQLALEDMEKLIGVPELVTFRICETLAPPNGALKLIAVLSTDKVCACRPPAASEPRIRARTEKDRINENLLG